MRKFFYDTEFCEGVQQNLNKPTIDLISIGIVDEEGNEYYAISNDFNLSNAWHKNDNTVAEPNYWLRENVLKKVFNDLRKFDNDDLYEYFTLENLYTLLQDYGKSNYTIQKEILDFIKPSKESPVELYGYYSAYDHVVLCWLFDKMIDLPEGMPMYTTDLRQMIDIKINDVINNICYSSGNHTIWNKKEALDFIKSKHDYPKQSNEHNALDDAKWNLELYKFLTKKENNEKK
jgi:hypothetical protein